MKLGRVFVENIGDMAGIYINQAHVIPQQVGCALPLARRVLTIELNARRLTGNQSKRIGLISTTANVPLAQSLSETLGVPLFSVNFCKDARGLWNIKLPRAIAGTELFIIHTANTGTMNEDTMQLRTLLDEISRLSPNERPAKVVASSLHMPYARQERKAEPREPISAEAMVNLLTSIRYRVARGLIKENLFTVDGRRVVDRFIVANLHAAAIEGFFPVPVDHLDARSLIVEFALTLGIDLSKLMVTGPDIGRVKMARLIAQDIFDTDADEHLLNILKVRTKKEAGGVSQTISRAFGEVKGKDVLLVDDMIDTGGTITKAVRVLKEAEANNIYVVAVHGILSGPAIERLSNCPDITKIGLVDTLDIPNEKIAPIQSKVVILSFAQLLARVIEKTFYEQTIRNYQSE